MTRPVLLLAASSWLVIVGLCLGQSVVPTKVVPGSKCALIIPRGNGEVCVSYQSVDRAFNQAATEMKLPKLPKADLENDQLGTVLVETSKLLAKEYKLPHDAIHAGLPLIDTRKTVIDRYCPARLKRPRCNAQRYRATNGFCNNMERAHWGAAQSPFRRLLAPSYADGVSLPRVSVTGEQLPTARYISAVIHRDQGYHDHAVTVFLPAFGQLIDHDMAFGGETKDPATGSEPKCCDVSPDRRHPACWPIDIPVNDPFYSLFRRRCLEFVRSGTGLKENCRLGSRSTFNAVSSFIDANFIYGSDDDTSIKLRTFHRGLLRSNPVFGGRGLKDLLPPKSDNPDEGCKRPSRDVFCFIAGDQRVNQQMMLVAQHTIFMREHNRIANELGRINPHWNDEKIFQETRHIIIAMLQHITYNEFLPMVLGKDIMKRYNLLLQKEGMGNFYNPKLDPTLPISFFAAAFRFGHSLIPSAIERWSVSHKFIGGRRLSEMLNRPFDVYQGGTCDQYLAGFMNQVSQAVDDSVSGELTNHLFQEPQKSFGADLASLNMQRGRDHGMPGYNAFREFCGLPKARQWRDLSGSFTNETLLRYSQIYASVDDIDLWTAGISERPLAGSMVGPVFGCIMGETFKNLRYGDRFWYENGGWPSSFTLDQLNEIRRIKLSRIVCDNSDNLESAQVYVMVLPDPDINPRVPCKSSVLPRLNLQLWRDSSKAAPTNNKKTGSSSFQHHIGRPSGGGGSFNAEDDFPGFEQLLNFFPKPPSTFDGRFQ